MEMRTQSQAMQISEPHNQPHLGGSKPPPALFAFQRDAFPTCLQRELSFCGLCCLLCTASAFPASLLLLRVPDFPGKSCYPEACMPAFASQRKGGKSMGSCEPKVRLGDDFPLLLCLSFLHRAC